MPGQTPSQTVGPFFHYGLIWKGGADLVADGHDGRIVIVGRVTDGDGQPVPDALVEIWQEVLLVRPISAEDDFFALGGDSLSATRLFARINRRFGADLPLRAIFENPTLSNLAGLLQNAKPAPASRVITARRPSRQVKVVG